MENFVPWPFNLAPSAFFRPSDKLANSLPPNESTVANHGWPLAIQRALARLIQTHGQADKDEIAARPEAGLIDLRFGLGTRVRNEFGLWQEYRALLLDRQKAKFEGRASLSNGLALMHPDAYHTCALGQVAVLKESLTEQGYEGRVILPQKHWFRFWH